MWMYSPLKFLRRCTDGAIHAIHIVAESVALLLGMHLMLVLHLVQLVTANPIESVRQTTSLTREGRATTTTIIHNTRQIQGERTGERIQPYDEVMHSRFETNHIASKRRFGVRARFEHFTDLLAEQTYRAIYRMANSIEARGGRAGQLLRQVRRNDAQLDVRLVHRLPTEIVTHILVLASMPGTPHGIPTKVALLSKAHHRLITPKLYANIHLTDSIAFRRFRMTLAVHNPSLGHHVRALSVASSRFDLEGYLPDQVAEHVTLGVGIEQILLAAPNLQHLYFDLFSLAALHNGTASRLERGALPISLTTEFSLPQYLALPTFVHLKHVELTVFGLDSSAVDWFRQVLPCLRSLTLRWVARQGVTSPYATGTIQSVQGLSAAESAWLDQSDRDVDSEELSSWREGGRRRTDFDSFVEAVELLRRWPFHAEAQAEGSRLDALTIFAWPKAYRELRKHYSASESTFIDGVRSSHQPARFWNRSLATFNEDEEALLGQRRSILGQDDPRRQPDERIVQPPAPLRIGVDETHRSGPRRGPLKEWCSQQKSAVWST